MCCVECVRACGKDGQTHRQMPAVCVAYCVCVCVGGGVAAAARRTHYHMTRYGDAANMRALFSD